MKWRWFFSEKRCLVFGLKLTLSAMSSPFRLTSQTGSQLSLISISQAVYTLERLQKCYPVSCQALLKTNERKRKSGAKKVNIHGHISCAYVAKIQPVWKQLPEWEIVRNQTRPVSSISCVPTKRSTKEIRFPHKIICTWQGKGMKKETCICASFWGLRFWLPYTNSKKTSQE